METPNQVPEQPIGEVSLVVLDLHVLEGGHKERKGSVRPIDREELIPPPEPPKPEVKRTKSVRQKQYVDANYINRGIIKLRLTRGRSKFIWCQFTGSATPRHANELLLLDKLFKKGLFGYFEIFNSHKHKVLTQLMVALYGFSSNEGIMTRSKKPSGSNLQMMVPPPYTFLIAESNDIGRDLLVDGFPVPHSNLEYNPCCVCIPMLVEDIFLLISAALMILASAMMQATRKTSKNVFGYEQSVEQLEAEEKRENEESKTQIYCTDFWKGVGTFIISIPLHSMAQSLYVVSNMIVRSIALLNDIHSLFFVRLLGDVGNFIHGSFENSSKVVCFKAKKDIQYTTILHSMVRETISIFPMILFIAGFFRPEVEVAIFSNAFLSAVEMISSSSSLEIAVGITLTNYLTPYLFQFYLMCIDEIEVKIFDYFKKKNSYEIAVEMDENPDAKLNRQRSGSISRASSMASRAAKSRSRRYTGSSSARPRGSRPKSPALVGNFMASTPTEAKGGVPPLTLSIPAKKEDVYENGQQITRKVEEVMSGVEILSSSTPPLLVTPVILDENTRPSSSSSSSSSSTSTSSSSGNPKEKKQAGFGASDQEMDPDEVPPPPLTITISPAQDRNTRINRSSSNFKDYSGGMSKAQQDHGNLEKALEQSKQEFNQKKMEQMEQTENMRVIDKAAQDADVDATAVHVYPGTTDLGLWDNNQDSPVSPSAIGLFAPTPAVPSNSQFSGIQPFSLR